MTYHDALFLSVIYEGVAQITLLQLTHVQNVLLRDLVRVFLFVGKAEAVEPQDDHRLMNSGVLADADRGTRRDARQRKKHGGHEEQDEDANGQPANDIESHATIL